MTNDKHKYYELFKRLANISIGVFITMLILFCVLTFIGKSGISIYSILNKIGLYILFISLGLALLFELLTGIIGKYLGIDEDTEEFKRAVKEAVQEYKEEEQKKPKPTIFDESDIHIPLKGLTPQQQAVIHQLLQKIHVNDKGFLRNAELMAFVRALSADGNIDDTNLDDVVRWIEYVTKYKVDTAHFKSEYSYRPTDKNITKMGNLIRREFDKLR